MKFMAVIAAAAISLGGFSAMGASPTEAELRARAEEIHKKAISLDSHTDAPLEWEAGKGSLAGGNTCVNLSKMKKGRLDATYCAAWVPSYVKVKGRKVKAPLNDATFERIWKRTNHLVDLIHSEAGKNAQACGIARTGKDVRRLKKEGKKAILIGVENGLGIGHDIDRIDELAKRGVSYITLTHTYDNQLCTSSTHCGDRRKGLTETGRKAVERMNRLGILVDVSHASEKTFYDVISLTTKPITATHSGVKALCNSDRNLTDDQLRALARNGGVVQIVAYKGFIRKGGRGANLKRMMDHLDHAVKVAGIDHVGIGTDFDGGGKIPGLMDHSDFINITVELLRRGYSEEDITKILGGNFLRVLDAQ